MTTILAVLFDFGETLVERVVDDEVPLSSLRVRAFSDALPTIKQLARSGYRLAIVSNTTQSTEQHMRTALRSIGFQHYFDVVVTSYDLGCEKPDPHLFRCALKQLGCLAEHAIMVGNDPSADIGGASDIGLGTILINRSAPIILPPNITPDITVTSLAEIPNLLSEWSRS